MSVDKQIRPFRSVLVANRGEIAVRIFRTLRRMGYRSVAVYSDADRHGLHVQAADSAVFIGESAPRESYLNIEAIIEAARRSGADAIHPGYGFLAENEAFADAVDSAGLVFVGPAGASVRAMGNKAQAKRLLMAAGMPCVPGYQGADQSDTAFMRAAADIGFPVMVKAAAGGGGRGMRLVRDAGALAAALASAKSEALAAFGSDELILERAVVAPRHVEIQVLADSHGHVLHLGERDCSVQRRHQKLIEEAPSPAVDAALRERMGEAAVRSARAIGYIGAGTMEFLLDADGSFYFMEMNTRLQVEHAVTEAITGLDLVEWQLRIAAGEPLPMRQSDIRMQGHAIEVRLAAEDVAAGFLPQTGPVLCWRSPAMADGGGQSVRVDHALATGATVSPYYDSMIAKLVAHGGTRDEALRKLRHALEHCVLLGLPTNQGFLADCLDDPVFAQGAAVHTGFIEERFGPKLAQRLLPAVRTVAMAAFASVAARLPISVDGAMEAASLFPGAAHLVLAFGDARWQAQIRSRARLWELELRRVDLQQADSAPPIVFHLRDARWLDDDSKTFRIECDGMVERVTFAQQDEWLHLFHAGRAWGFEQVDTRRRPPAESAGGAVVAPLTGRIVDVAVQEGDAVCAGQKLVVLEAMKMEHALTAPIAGTVSELRAQAGGQSTRGTLLMRVVPADEAPAG